MTRDSKFDFYKGFLMLGVIWGHTITALLCNEPNNNNIHSFFRIYDMPLFMLISGYFLSLSINKYDFKLLLLNKTTTILVPTILWSLITSKFTLISGYYFLWAVYLSSCICIIVYKTIHSKSLRFIIFSLLILILHLQPYSIHNMPFLFPYFILGFYGKLIFRNCNLFIIFVFVLGFCFWNSSYSVWNSGCYLLAGNNIGFIILFRTFMAILGIILAKRIMDLLYNTISIEYTWFYNLMIKTGKETLAIYILQAILIERILRKICLLLQYKLNFNVFNIDENILGYFYAPVISIITLYCLLKLISLIKRNKHLKYLFGFKSC